MWTATPALLCAAGEELSRLMSIEVSDYIYGALETDVWEYHILLDALL